METISPIINRWRHQAEIDPDGFWAKAAESLPWFRKWDRVFEWNRPTLCVVRELIHERCTASVAIGLLAPGCTRGRDERPDSRVR